jgi:hypothetical protein
MFDMRRRRAHRHRKLNPRDELIQEIATDYERLRYPLDRQLMLEQLVETWIESADDLPLRKHSLELVDRIDDHTTQLAVGKIVNLPEEVEEMRSALACLVVLDHESRVRDMVRKMMNAVIIWAIKQEVAREALVLPLLKQIPLARLRGFQRWTSI